jgi:DNA-directed RNA polymerase specialized sigma24 family protein
MPAVSTDFRIHSRHWSPGGPWPHPKGTGRQRVCHGVVVEPTGAPTSFEEFATTIGVRVRRALVASYGVEIGTEAAADAMAVAWERWAAIQEMHNPAGYLYRVGQTKARPHVRWARRGGLFELPAAREGLAEDVLDALGALRTLKPAERAAVLLTKSYGFSYGEVADVLGVSVDAVTNHVHRGLRRLRERLGHE